VCSALIRNEKKEQKLIATYFLHSPKVSVTMSKIAVRSLRALLVLIAHWVTVKPVLAQGCFVFNIRNHMIINPTISLNFFHLSWNSDYLAIGEFQLLVIYWILISCRSIEKPILLVIASLSVIKILLICIVSMGLHVLSSESSILEHSSVSHMLHKVSFFCFTLGSYSYAIS
jgi:hypothetical protein